MNDASTVLYDQSRPLAPLDDADEAAAEGSKRNFAKVGSSRPSSLLYTYGPGAIIDLPNFTVMPAGLDDWDRIWKRRDGNPSIQAPRLLHAVRLMMASSVEELRPFPWQEKSNPFSREGSDLGVPARVFPQWLRCTGCDRLGPLPVFSYRNTNPMRTDEAVFEHYPCHGRPRAGAAGPQVAKKGSRRQPAVTARYLLACPDGHLDEFPYDRWVHRGGECPKADVPTLRMVDRTAAKGASAVIICASCEATRGMNEALGAAGRAKLPRCRGRLPHLDGFAEGGCDKEPRLMLVGASNLWFPAVQSIIVMPRLNEAEKLQDLADRMRVVLGENLQKFGGQTDVIRALLGQGGPAELRALSDTELTTVIEQAVNPPVQTEGAGGRAREMVARRSARAGVAISAAGAGSRASSRRAERADAVSAVAVCGDAASGEPGAGG